MKRDQGRKRTVLTGSGLLAMGARSASGGGPGETLRSAASVREAVRGGGGNGAGLLHGRTLALETTGNGRTGGEAGSRRSALPACGRAKGHPRGTHTLVERVVAIVLAVHRRLQSSNDTALEARRLTHDKPSDTQVSRLPRGQCAIVFWPEPVLADADLHGCQPCCSHRSDAKPNRNVDDATLPAMCWRSSRERSRARDLSFLGAIPT